MPKDNRRIPSYRMVWGKIRYYQLLHELSEEQLASFLDVGIRTLKEYDRNAKNMTLDKLDNFLISSKLDLSELIAL